MCSMPIETATGTRIAGYTEANEGSVSVDIFARSDLHHRCQGAV
jgi:hypothetical protein